MTIMRFRARRIKGLLDVSSSDEGTSVTIRLPQAGVHHG
jgi:signal transduction histidine kinase